MVLDFSFHYKYIIRYIYIQKLFRFSINGFKIPVLENLFIYFSVKRLNDIMSLSVSNVFYLIKYFLGKKLYITKFNSFFNLGVTYYNFRVNLTLKNNDMYFFLFYFSNDVFSFVNKQFIYTKILKNRLYLILKDMAFFTEKKNNVGFFNLKDFLHINFVFSNAFIDIRKDDVIKNFLYFLKLN